LPDARDEETPQQGDRWIEAGSMDEQQYDDDELGGREDDEGSHAGSGPRERLLITAAQAAELLCISEATLWELVKRDRLRCVEFVATGFQRPIRRFRLQDLVEFIDKAVG
jgi:hypothetical protein